MEGAQGMIDPKGIVNTQGQFALDGDNQGHLNPFQAQKKQLPVGSLCLLRTSSRKIILN